MDISVVIPSYNTQDTIAGTLESICQQQTNCAFEIILVDCSDHDLVKQEAARFPAVRYIHRESRFNPGEGRNIGAREAEGKLLVFVDADIILARDALEKAWGFYSPEQLAFGGALELNIGTSIGVSSQLEHYFFNHESQARQPACERKNLSSALLFMDRALFMNQGGFKDIPRMQDTEFTERLRTLGYHLYFYPGVLAYQTQDSSLKTVLRKIYINGQNLYFIRYKPRVTTIKKILFLILLPILGLAKFGRLSYRLLRFQPWSNKIRILLLLPVLLLGAAYWVAGFYNAIIFEKGISKSR